MFLNMGTNLKIRGILEPGAYLRIFLCRASALGVSFGLDTYLKIPGAVFELGTYLTIRDVLSGTYSERSTYMSTRGIIFSSGTNLEIRSSSFGLGTNLKMRGVSFLGRSRNAR